MKFDQLKEYNMRKIFLKNYTQDVTEKLDPNPFLRNQNWVYLWINSLKFYIVYLYCMPSWGLSKYIETKLQTTCFYFLQSFFRKQKRSLELVSLSHFLHDFWRKTFSCYILLTDQIWLSSCFCFLRYWAMYGL